MRGATYPIPPLQRVIFWSAGPFMHQRVTTFDPLDEARAWLASSGGRRAAAAVSR